MSAAELPPQFLADVAQYREYGEHAHPVLHQTDERRMLIILHQAGLALAQLAVAAGLPTDIDVLSLRKEWWGAEKVIRKKSGWVMYGQRGRPDEWPLRGRDPLDSVPALGIALIPPDGLRKFMTAPVREGERITVIASRSELSTGQLGALHGSLPKLRWVQPAQMYQSTVAFAAGLLTPQ